MLSAALYAQDHTIEQGQSIGKVTTQGDLIVVELNDKALGEAHLFDLANHTLLFTPEGSHYRVATGPLEWDSDYGPLIADSEVTLHQFTFPFSGQRWKSFHVGTTGSIRFGPPPPENNPSATGSRDSGVSVARFDQLAEAAPRILDSAPAICVFLKPRMSGPRYVKQQADRVVITWDLMEPFGNIQDFTWDKTINRFQAVLRSDGTIQMSYKEVAARDAIVGLYPLPGNTEKDLTTLNAGPHPALPAHLDVQNIKFSVVDDVLLKATLEMRGSVLPEGNSALDGIVYRIVFETPESIAASSHAHTTIAWTVEGFGERSRPARYVAFGPGVSRHVKIVGNSMTLQGVLPAALGKAAQVAISAEVKAPGKTEPVESVPPRVIRLSGIHNPEVHFSSLSRKDGPFGVVYESFHYLELPRPQDLSCSVIKALGDGFDFLAYYSDFRIDNQEAGTPSDGPTGGNVTGIAQTQHDLEEYCTQGRFQWEFVQPVFVGSNQMQERPPQNAPVGGDRDITFYLHQLEESSPDRKIRPYNYAMSQLGHEMGHRWAAFVSAKIDGKSVPLGPVHWARGLQAPVAFPYQRPTEASAMGGSVWQDNLDGTYSQLDDDYYVPATGYSYLDLYLMGLISAREVPDFFILKNLQPAGTDKNGRPLFKADRVKVTIQDVIAAEGPRLPDVDHSQREFNTGIVVVVEHGQTPSRDLIERANGIRQQWVNYWGITTGHRASMTVIPR